jgi:hypothetical protein
LAETWQTEKLSEFYDVCKGLDFSRNVKLPEFEQVMMCYVVITMHNHATSTLSIIVVNLYPAATTIIPCFDGTICA